MIKLVNCGQLSHYFNEIYWIQWTRFPNCQRAAQNIQLYVANNCYFFPLFCSQLPWVHPEICNQCFFNGKSEVSHILKRPGLLTICQNSFTRLGLNP